MYRSYVICLQRNSRRRTMTQRFRMSNVIDVGVVMSRSSMKCVVHRREMVSYSKIRAYVCSC